MLEGNIGLAFAMNVHRYGPHRETLSRKCQSITSADIQRVTTRYLAATNATIGAISAQATVTATAIASVRIGSSPTEGRDGGTGPPPGGRPRPHGKL